MKTLPLFPLFAFISTLVLLPTLFGELMAASLGKLHLSPKTGLFVHERVVATHPLAIFGLGGLWGEDDPRAPRDNHRGQLRRCVVPTGLAVYELLHRQRAPARPWSCSSTAGLNIVVCYRVARPV